MGGRQRGGPQRGGAEPGGGLARRGGARFPGGVSDRGQAPEVQDEEVPGGNGAWLPAPRPPRLLFRQGARAARLVVTRAGAVSPLLLKTLAARRQSVLGPLAPRDPLG